MRLCQAPPAGPATTPGLRTIASSLARHADAVSRRMRRTFTRSMHRAYHSDCTTRDIRQDQIGEADMKPCHHRICASILVVATTVLAAPFAPAKDAAIPHETVRVPGLRAAAEIRVDRWGVPHLYARSETDLFYLQGFNAARDRLFQIDLWRRRGLGLLSEV